MLPLHRIGCLAALLSIAPAAAQTLSPVAAADYSRDHDGLALLVYRAGELVFERYEQGHAADRPHHIYSGTKSFASVVALLAEADGILDLDESVADTITEWKGDARRERITVRHLLDFTSGLRKIDSQIHSRRTDDKYALAVSTRAVREPGERFQYGSVHLTVFGEFLKRKLRAHDPLKHADADYVSYLEERLLDPIGCEVADWIRDAAGNPMVPYGAFLTAREWAKFGNFLLDRGEVDGEVLLDPKRLAQCFVGSRANPNYGLNFWLVAEDRRAAANIPADTFGAFGMYKQKLWVVPSLELVIVRFGKVGVVSGFRDSEFFERLLASPGTAASRPDSRPDSRPAIDSGSSDGALAPRSSE